MGLATDTAPAEGVTLQPESKTIRIDSKQPTPAPEDIAPVTSPAKPKIDIEAFKASLGFDATEIKKRYLAERDKRLRPDGNAQYREAKHDFAHYLEDPYTPRIERAPIECSIDFLVLGGGFGGLLLGARLVEARITNIRIIDKAGDFGGTWYWNRYPGAACDIGALPDI
jgi:cyclohexanone monooxygenase